MKFKVKSEETIVTLLGTQSYSLWGKGYIACYGSENWVVFYKMSDLTPIDLMNDSDIFNEDGLSGK